MSSVSLSVVIGLASLVIITVSMVLQYISHRHNVVDSRFEREQKIEKQLGYEPVVAPGFTQDEYEISVRLFDVDVRERSGLWYKLKKLLIPTTDIEGTTVVKLEVKPDNEIPPGLYIIEGWEDGKRAIRGTLTRVPDENDMLTIELDTVNPYVVPPTLTDNMMYTSNLRLVEDDNVTRFAELSEDLFTPDSEVYQ